MFSYDRHAAEAGSGVGRISRACCRGSVGGRSVHAVKVFFSLFYPETWLWRRTDVSLVLPFLFSVRAPRGGATLFLQLSSILDPAKATLGERVDTVLGWGVVRAYHAASDTYVVNLGERKER